MKNISVCIEGADGIGKTSQVKLLAEALNAAIVKYPYYDSLTGKLILRILNGEYKLDGEAIDRAAIIQSLMTINRYETLRYIPKSVNIVFDRFDLSLYVYGGMDGLPEDFIEAANSCLPKPDITIVLAGTPWRLNGDYYEKSEKQKVVSSLYIKLAKRLYLPIINANQAKEKVHSEIMDIINKKIGEMNGS